MYCRRPASSTPTAWMCPFGKGQIQTSFHAGGMTRPLTRSTSLPFSRLPCSSAYVKPLPARRRVHPGWLGDTVRSLMVSLLPTWRALSRSGLRNVLHRKGYCLSDAGRCASEVTLGNRTDDLHGVPLGDAGERGVGGGVRADRRSEVVEVPDHRGRRVEVQLAALHVADLEAVRQTGRNVDEGASWADPVVLADEDPVLARHDEECLRCVVVDVHRRSEPGRLIGLEEGEGALRL